MPGRVVKLFPETKILSSHRDRVAWEVAKVLHVTKRKDNCISQALVSLRGWELDTFLVHFEEFAFLSSVGSDWLLYKEAMFYLVDNYVPLVRIQSDADTP